MKYLWLYLLLNLLYFPVIGQTIKAEDYYVSAFNEMSDIMDTR